MIAFQDLNALFFSEHPDIELLCFDELASTNQYLYQFAKKSLHKAFCITSRQTSGYGQRNRTWLSNENSLTFSLLLPVPVAPSGIDGITQLVALKIVETLSDYSNQRITIKWPNDLYVDDRKVGGILLEIPTFDHEQSWIVLGVGLNLKLSDNTRFSPAYEGVNAGLIEFKDCSQSMVLRFLSDLVQNQSNLFDDFRSGLFHDYLCNYRLVDYFSENSPVIVYDNDQILSGLYKGLNSSGEVQVLIENTVMTYRSGSVSIRPVKRI